MPLVSSSPGKAQGSSANAATGSGNYGGGNVNGPVGGSTGKAAGQLSGSGSKITSSGKMGASSSQTGGLKGGTMGGKVSSVGKGPTTGPASTKGNFAGSATKGGVSAKGGAIGGKSLGVSSGKMQSSTSPVGKGTMGGKVTGNVLSGGLSGYGPTGQRGPLAGSLAKGGNVLAQAAQRTGQRGPIAGSLASPDVGRLMNMKGNIEGEFGPSASLPGRFGLGGLKNGITQNVAFRPDDPTGLRGPTGPLGEPRMGPSSLDSLGLRDMTSPTGVLQTGNLKADATAHMIGRGWTPEQSAGITGNIAQEAPGLDKDALYAKENSYGLAQWRNERLSGLKSSFGDQPSFNAQLDYIDRELRGTSPYVDKGAVKTGQRFMSDPSMSAPKAATTFSKSFERPNTKYANNSNRVSQANQALASLGGTPSAAPVQTASLGPDPLRSTTNPTSSFFGDPVKSPMITNPPTPQHRPAPTPSMKPAAYNISGAELQNAINSQLAAAENNRAPTQTYQATADGMISDAQRSRALMNQGIQMGDLGDPTPLSSAELAQRTADQMTSDAQRSRALMNQGIQLGYLGEPTPGSAPRSRSPGYPDAPTSTAGKQDFGIQPLGSGFRPTSVMDRPAPYQPSQASPGFGPTSLMGDPRQMAQSAPGSNFTPMSQIDPSQPYQEASPVNRSMKQDQARLPSAELADATGGDLYGLDPFADGFDWGNGLIAYDDPASAARRGLSPATQSPYVDNPFMSDDMPQDYRAGRPFFDAGPSPLGTNPGIPADQPGYDPNQPSEVAGDDDQGFIGNVYEKLKEFVTDPRVRSMDKINANRIMQAQLDRRSSHGGDRQTREDNALQQFANAQQQSPEWFAMLEQLLATA